MLGGRCLFHEKGRSHHEQGRSTRVGERLEPGFWALGERGPAAGTQGLDAVSCPTASRCWAVGGRTIVATTNAGVSWSLQTPPSGVTSLAAISCPDPSHCWAVA